MALEYYTPGVYVEEVSGGDKPVTAAPTSIVWHSEQCVAL